MSYFTYFYCRERFFQYPCKNLTTTTMKGAFFSTHVSTFSVGDVDTFAHASHSRKRWKEIGRGWKKPSLPCF